MIFKVRSITHSVQKHDACKSPESMVILKQRMTEGQAEMGTQQKVEGDSFEHERGERHDKRWGQDNS